MRLSKTSLHLIAVASVLVAGAVGSGWESVNTPSALYPWCHGGGSDAEKCYEMNFDVLKALPGPFRVTSHAAWSDSYWPDFKGGIAYRWTTDQVPWKYVSPTITEVRQMSAEQIRALSPAEKFDVYRALKTGKPLDYALTKIVNIKTDEKGPEWQGLCHGWAFAATNHAEPAPVTVEADGVKIEFGSSDVKALMTYYYATYNNAKKDAFYAGERCSGGSKKGGGLFGRKRESGCNPLNAGAFHLILANQLGRLHEGFVIDIDSGEEVWNHPIVAVDFEYRDGSASGAADRTVRQVHVRAKVRYVDENDAHWEPVVGTRFQNEKALDYSYTLDIAKNGNVIGGSWDARSRTPDFVWRRRKLDFENQVMRPEGDLSLLKELYVPSIP